MDRIDGYTADWDVFRNGTLTEQSALQGEIEREGSADKPAFNPENLGFLDDDDIA